jgi:hypothetical protein
VGNIVSIDIPNIVYHGTTDNHVASLMKGIDPLANLNKRLDFGLGFYTTNSKKRANKISKSRARVSNNINRRLKIKSHIKAIVFTFEVDVEKIAKLEVKVFNDTDDEWREFIYNGRMCNKHAYDITYGPVADCKMLELLDDIDNNRIDKQEFKRRLQSLGSDYYQLVFHSEKAIQCLNYKKSEVVV